MALPTANNLTIKNFQQMKSFKRLIVRRSLILGNRCVNIYRFYTNHLFKTLNLRTPGWLHVSSSLPRPASALLPGLVTVIACHLRSHKNPDTRSSRPRSWSWDRNFAVLVLALGVLVFKDRSRLFSRPINNLLASAPRKIIILIWRQTPWSLCNKRLHHCQQVTVVFYLVQ